MSDNKIQTNYISADCDFFKFSHMEFDPSRYDFFFQRKIQIFKQHMTAHPVVNEQARSIIIDEISSPKRNFRQRCRFAFILQEPYSLCYAMWDGGEPSIIIENFPFASKSICNTMPILLNLINSSMLIGNGLRAVNFISTLSKELIICLSYEIPLDDQWKIEAAILRVQLEKLLPDLRAIQLIGRSKGIKYLLDIDIVKEEFALNDGRTLSYLQVEDGFSNPNAIVNISSLNWICSVVKYISSKYIRFFNSTTSSTRTELTPATTNNNIDSTKDNVYINDNNNDNSNHLSINNINNNNNNFSESTFINPNNNSSNEGFDLLELYCGNGNHTIAIAGFCRRLLAVELNKSLCNIAMKNLILNNITNAKILACDSERFAKSILKHKSYLDKDSNITYHFNAVLVDPPRCGLDSTTCSLISYYDNIIYISCNPVALFRDLDKLCQTHRISRMALLDQFAYTPHLECAVYLEKIE